MTVWTIETLPLYRFASPGPEVLFQRGFGEMIDMIIHAFLLRSGDSTILLDTGLPEDFSALNKALRLRKGPSAGFFPIGDPLAQRLAAASIALDAVVVTSFGPYAVGGLPAFAGMELFASRRGLDDLIKAEEPALVHPVPDPSRAILERATPFSGELEMRPGLLLVETGIHHPASAAVIADTTAGRIAIADPVFVARNLVDGLALGAAEHAAGWHGMVRRLAARADAIIPIHDCDPAPVCREVWHESLEVS